MDIWALCRRDHGLTWAEFQDITLAQLEALEERRAVQIRHARHDAAFIVATLFNVNGSGEHVSPLDFLPGFELDPAEVEAARWRKETIKGIRRTLGTLPKGTKPADVKILVSRMIQRLKDGGHDDAEQILDEAFPNLGGISGGPGY